MLDRPLRHFARYTEILSGLMRHGLGYFFLDPVALPQMLIPGGQRDLAQPNLELMGVHLRRIADRISREVLRQILCDGCFHGDPHPGNILILPSGKIAFIDFGLNH